MPTLAEVRAQFPQYDDLSDTQLLEGLHKKFYSDMPMDEFAAKIGTPPTEKKTGLGAALMQGLTSFGSQNRVAYEGATGDATTAAKQGLAREEASPYQSQTGLDKITDAYSKDGLWGATKETAGQVPYFLAENAPAIGASMLGARTGALAGAAVGNVPGAVIGGIAGGLLPLFTQQVGANAERQAQVNPDTPVDFGTAAATALPQALMAEIARVPALGKTVVGKLLGPEVADAIAKGNTQAAERLAKENLFDAIAKGTATGAATMIPASVAQEALSRYQAGQPLTDDTAIKSYIEAAYQGGMLSPMGAVGRYADQSRAQGQVEAKAAADAADAAKQAADTEAARKQSPEYAQQVSQAYQDAQTQYAQLVAQRDAIPNRGADEADRLRRRDLAKQAEEFKKFTLGPAAEEFNTVRGQGTPQDPTTDHDTQGAFIRNVLGEEIPQEANALGYSEPMIVPPAKSQESTPPSPYGDVGQQAAQAGLSTLDPQVAAMHQQGAVNLTGPEMTGVNQARINTAVQALQSNGLGMRFVQEYAAAKKAKGDLPAVPGLSASETRAVYDAMRTQAVDELLARQQDLKATDAPQTAPKPDGFTEQYGTQYAQEQQRRQQQEARAPQQEVNNLFRSLFGDRDTLGTPKTTLEPTAEALQGRTPVDTLGNAEIRDAQGNRLPSQYVEGQNTQTQRLSETDLKGQLKDLLRQREALRATGLNNKGFGSFGDVAAGSKPGDKKVAASTGRITTEDELTLRKQIAETVERLRSAKEMGDALRQQAKPEQRRNLEGYWSGPVNPESFEAQGKGRVIERVAQPEAPHVFQKAGHEFKLHNGAPEEVTPENVRRQLDETLARPDLAPETRATLENAHNLTASEDTNALLADQLRRINEQGEGLATQVQAPVKTPDGKLTLQTQLGPSEKPLTHLQEISNAVKLRQGVQQEGVQKEMFPGTSGDIKTTRKQFVDFMRKAQTTLKKDNSEASKFLGRMHALPDLKNALNAARRKLKALFESKAPARAAAEAEYKAVRERMDKLMDEKSNLEEAQKFLESDVEGLWKDAKDLNEKLPQAPDIRRSEIYKHAQEQLEHLRDVRDSMEQVREELALDDATLRSRPEEKDTEIAAATADTIEHEKNVKEIEDRITDLRRTQKERREAEARGNERRAIDAKDKEAVRQRAEETRRAQELPGRKVEALAPEDRALREVVTEGKSAKEVTVVNDRTGRNPVRAKGGIVKRINALKERIDSQRAARKSSVERSVEAKKVILEKLETQYKNTPSAEAREELAAKIDSATQDLRRAEENLKKDKEVVKYPGEDTDRKQLAYFEQQLEHIESEIDAQRTREAELGPRKKDILDLQARKDAARATRAAEAKEATQRADASRTTAKETTQREIMKARKQGPTLYEGNKGPSGQAELKARRESLEEKDKTALREDRKGGQDTARVRKELDDAFPQKTLYEGKAPKVYVHATVKDAANATREKLPKGTKAFVKDGVAHLISENIHEGDALAVLLHDLGGHIGFRNAFNEGQYKALHNAILSWASKKPGSVEHNIYTEVQRRLKDAKVPDKDLQDETIGHAIEVAVQQGVNPEANTGIAAGWLKKVMQLLRTALGKFLGTNDVRLSPQQLVDMAYGAAHMEMVNAKPMEKAVGQPEHLLFSKTASYADSLKDAGEITDRVLGWRPSAIDTLKQNLLGLKFRTQFVDAAAPLEKAAEKMKDGGLQMMSYLRWHGQKNNFVAQAITHGAPQLRINDKGERLVEAKNDGASIKKVIEAIKPVAKKAGGEDANSRLFSMYMIAKRAARVGMDKLGIDGITPQELDTVRKQVKDSGLQDAYDHAASIYADFNKDLLNFLADSGRISKGMANELTRHGDYVPYYRVRGGNAELVIGSETPIRIGSIKDQPYLHELVGGDHEILDFLHGSVQNTAMITDMALRNLAAKAAAFDLHDIGAATISKKGNLAGPEVIHFFHDGDAKSAKVNTEDLGIPSDLLVKGLSGIPTMVPAVVRIMGMPAKFLRKMVTLSPLYAVKQVVRDSVANTMYAGSNAWPIASNLKHLARSDTRKVLERQGTTGGQVYTGTNEDIVRMLRDTANGSKVNAWALIGKAEAMAMAADASSRAGLYDNLRKQGLSELQASYLTLDSMNFNKRGLSPSVHYINQLIPFFNSQIQGLDVLYRAMRGKMPFNEKLKIREKLLTRGMMMAAGSMAYAYAMQNDDSYKNANPDEKYGNWFVHVPGVDQPIRVAIPFEIGYIFKSIPEMVVNQMAGAGKEDAWGAFKYIMSQVIPGASSYGVPQAMKPALEAGLNKSMYTGNDIESKQEQGLLPEARIRENTSQLAQLFGKTTGTSPVKFDYLVRGYGASMGLALTQALDFAWPKEGPEQATKRMSDMSVVGPLFQPNDAQGIINGVYEKVTHIEQVKKTFESLINKGQAAEAQEFMQKNVKEISEESVAGSFTQQMGQLTKAEQAVRASSMKADDKRKMLDQIRQLKIQMASGVKAVFGKT